MRYLVNPLLRGLTLALAVSAGLSMTSPAYAAETDDASDEQSFTNRIVREGVVVEFDVYPATAGKDVLMAADWADVRFRITDESTGEPITGRYPAAWMDLAKAWEAKGDKPLSCRQRVETYLQGIVGVRPMIDLNAHFLLVMNADPSISVIDPAVGITGITNLFAQINLDGPGADWVKSENQKFTFVSMPLSDAVAVIDNATFKVHSNIPAGDEPTRIELQSDQRYLWVGNNGKDPKTSGVSVLDAINYKPVTFFPTGAGHHEIAFNSDGRNAFVSNRNDGTLTVIDIRNLKKVKDVKVGSTPISVAYSELSNAVYVADAKTGKVVVIDGDSFEQRAEMDTKPGLGPMRFSQDGRWGIVVNPFADTIFVIDATKDKIAHELTVGDKPYQVTFTRSFGYIRSLGTSQVGLLPLSQLDEAEKPQLSYIPAGQNPPGAAAQISISDAMVPSVKQAAAYIVNQAEGTVHYYMEGMGAPMGAFRNYGHQARAVETVDRSLNEQQPGTYIGQAKIPVEGEYDVAFMMYTPRFLHCFSVKVNPNPEVDSTTKRLTLDFTGSDKKVEIGSKGTVRFKLANPRSGKPLEGVDDMLVMYYRSDGRGRRVIPASEKQGGEYEAQIEIDSVASYYVFVGSRSQSLNYSELPFLTVIGTPAAAGGK